MNPEPPTPAPKYRSASLDFLFGPAKICFSERARAEVPPQSRVWRQGSFTNFPFQENSLTFLCFPQQLEHENQRKSPQSDLRAHFCVLEAALLRAAAARGKCGDLAVIQARVSSSGEADVAEIHSRIEAGTQTGSSLILNTSFSCRNLESPPLKGPRRAPRVGGARVSPRSGTTLELCLVCF